MGRNEDIARLYAQPGMTLQKVGDLYDLTRERVRQILNEQGVTARHVRTRKPCVCRWCDKPITEETRGGTGLRYHSACRPKAFEARRQRARQRMILQVQEFARVHGRTPAGVDLNPASQKVSEARRREALACRAMTPLPHQSHVQDLFGSTSALIEAAGLSPALNGGAARVAAEKRRGEA